MNTTGTSSTEVSWRRVGALVGAVALGIAVLAGCGGGSEVDDNTADTPSGQDSGDSEEQPSGDGLPEDFPDDVPLPQFTSAKKIGGESGPEIDSDWWSVLLMLESPTETPVEDYAAQLSDAGYTVESDAAATEATGPNWEISFHSSMDNTLTVGVISR